MAAVLRRIGEMTLDINKIKAAALAATHGEWKSEFRRGTYSEGSIESVTGTLIAIVAGANYGISLGGKSRDYEGDFDDDDEFEANANFITLANPAAVLELIERLENAERDAAMFRTVFGSMRNMRVDQITEEMILAAMKESE